MSARGAAASSTTLRALTPRQRLGILIALAGAAAASYQAVQGLVMLETNVRMALAAGSMAAAATALGTVPMMLAQNISRRLQDALLGFGAGVMLAAASFSLIVPGLDAARSLGYGAWNAGAAVTLAVLAGALLLMVIDSLVPHEHFVKGREGPAAKAVRRTWLFVLAIALHNLPEGAAIGVAFGGEDLGSAQALAYGIAIQDVPEGLVVALALRGIGYRRGTAAALAIASGLVEPVMALLAAVWVGTASAALPYGLGAAAGAMIYVVSHEIIPESHRQGHERLATFGLLIGFALMMLLDTALG